NKMKILHLSIIVILIILVLLPFNATFAQNMTNSTNQMPRGAIRTPGGGWVTPPQTTDENGSKLTIHYETGIPVSGYANTGHPPVIHMTIETNSKEYEKGDLITISVKEDDYMLQKYGNKITISNDDMCSGDP